MSLASMLEIIVMSMQALVALALVYMAYRCVVNERA
jgi:hypothetical protein